MGKKSRKAGKTKGGAASGACPPPPPPPPTAGAEASPSGPPADDENSLWHGVRERWHAGARVCMALATAESPFYGGLEVVRFDGAGLKWVCEVPKMPGSLARGGKRVRRWPTSNRSYLGRFPLISVDE